MLLVHGGTQLNNCLGGRRVKAESSVGMTAGVNVKHWIAQMWWRTHNLVSKHYYRHWVSKWILSVWQHNNNNNNNTWRLCVGRPPEAVVFPAFSISEIFHPRFYEGLKNKIKIIIIIIIIISDLHHYECVVPLATINLQNMCFWVMLTVSVKVRLWDSKSFRTVFIHVIWRHPGSLFKSSSRSAECSQDLLSISIVIQSCNVLKQPETPCLDSQGKERSAAL